MLDIAINFFKFLLCPRLRHQLPVIGSKWVLFLDNKSPVYTVIATYHGQGSSPVCVINEEKTDYKEIQIGEFAKNWREVGFDSAVYENAVKQGYKL